MSCIFCMIKDKIIPSSVVYENDYVLAFLDLSQANEGHTLVIPKKHFDTLFEVDDLYICEMMKAVKVVGNAIIKTFNCEGINVLNNSGTAAGQTVMHAHIHIIPRYENDGNNFVFNNNESKFDLVDIANQIKNNI